MSLARISSASSQLIRIHSSRPRSALLPPPGFQCFRIIGYLSRSAPRSQRRSDCPRAHALSCGRFQLSSTVSSVPIRRSEEHTSELQSLMRISYAVFCLKKKKQNKEHITYTHNNQ